jgi:hypothetical protein
VDGEYDAEIHPIDVSKLKKGDTIEISEVERAYGVSRNADADSRDKYRLCLLQLKTHIESRTTLRCKFEHDAVHIMTDEELDEYLWGRTVKAVHGLRRFAADTALVNTSEFADDRKRLSESRMQAQALIATAASKAESDARRDLRLSLPTVWPELPPDVD